MGARYMLSIFMLNARVPMQPGVAGEVRVLGASQNTDAISPE